MQRYSVGRGAGSFVLCLLMGLMWAIPMMILGGVLTLLGSGFLVRLGWPLPSWSPGYGVLWNIACFVLLPVGCLGVVKVISRSREGAAETERANDRTDARVGSLGFALGYGFVYLIVWSSLKQLASL